MRQSMKAFKDLITRFSSLVCLCFQYEEIDGFGLKEILAYKPQSMVSKVMCCEPEKEGKTVYMRKNAFVYTSFITFAFVSNV